MTARHRVLDVLDWCDRNRLELVVFATGVTVFAAGAWLVGGVTDAERLAVSTPDLPSVPLEPAPVGTLVPEATVDPAVPPFAAVSPASPTAVPAVVAVGPVASGTTPARLVERVQVGEPPVPAGIPGNCESWAPVFAAHGATPEEVEFFVPRIIRRETGCGRDTLNESSGDTGICQINPVHNRAGYFGRVFYGDGGWLGQLHGLKTRQDTDSPEWIGACLTLYRVCGSGPWAPPYSCANRRLP